MRKICIVVGSRANYASIRSVMQHVKDHPALELVTVVGASALLPRFGAVVDQIRKDGFNIDHTYYMIVEGENPATMAKSTGLGLMELANIFDNIRPDVVVTIGDRFETMSTAIAAAYMNIPLAHTMGGEVTGTIDESIRHAVTKFAHLHFPANDDAAQRIIKLGEAADTVFNVGCPRIDEVDRILTDEPYEDLNRVFDDFGGVGQTLDLNRPFLLVSQHPVTTEYGDGRRQIGATLDALEQLAMPTVMLWPNIDAGSDDIAKGIRQFRETRAPGFLHVFINLPMPVYVHLMDRCACLIGNSSSAIREGAFIGTPAVNLGTRQVQRQRGKNIIDADHDAEAIVAAVRKQLAHGKYGRDTLYGDATAGRKIADILAAAQVNVQKTITY
ncbi:MAG: UDP-N-acetylglucosamine 2-epimerase [Phycisphaerales bacterium JB063]